MTQDLQTAGANEEVQVSTAVDTALIKLEAWVLRNYAAPTAPHLNTVRRWARSGLIKPEPQKHGRDYFFHPAAKYTPKQSDA